jgi:uncharacterized protein YkwD
MNKLRGLLLLLTLVLVSACAPGTSTKTSKSKSASSETSDTGPTTTQWEDQLRNQGSGSTTTTPPTPVTTAPVTTPTPIPQPVAVDPCTDQLGSYDPTVAQFRTEVCMRVNQIRASAGAPPVTLAALHSYVAQSHAYEMYSNSYLSHTNLAGLGSLDRMRAAGISFTTGAENIARGQSTPQYVVYTWMSSDGHAANIMNPRFHRIGIGYAGRYWVLDFTD